MFARHQVNNPLKMKEKTHELVAHQDIIVETQVQNATPRTLFLESIRFIPAPQFEVFRFAEHGVIVNESDSKDTDAGAEPESPNPSGVRLATLSDVSSATRLAGTIPDGSVVVGTRMATLGPMANLKEGDVEQECDHPERSGIDLFFGVPRRLLVHVHVCVRSICSDCAASCHLLSSSGQQLLAGWRWSGRVQWGSMVSCSPTSFNASCQQQEQWRSIWCRCHTKSLLRRRSKSR